MYEAPQRSITVLSEVIILAGLVIAEHVLVGVFDESDARSRARQACHGVSHLS
jgi:hypothetical protein